MKQRSQRILLVLCLALVGLVLIADGVFLFRARERASLMGPALTGQLVGMDGPSSFGLPGLANGSVTAQPGGFTAKTKRDGSFILKLPAGVYSVSYVAPGHLAVSERVQVSAVMPTTVYPVLYPVPSGEPIPHLMRSIMSPGSGPIAYNTSVLIDATRSKNVVPDGIRWEIRDSSGRILKDPLDSSARPLQLKPSPIPGSSPLSFTFAPPAPGKYRLRLLLKNPLSKGREKWAEFTVEADNRGPKAMPYLIAGPNPPGRNSDGKAKEGSGLSKVVAGDKVFLAAWAQDKNYPSPELYSPDGRQPDAYGRNFPLPQSRFTWRWRLYELKSGNGRTDVTRLLRASGTGDAATSPYPWFVAERPGRYLAALWADDHDPSGNRPGNPSTLELTVLAPGDAIVPERACQQRGCHAGVAATESSHGKMGCQTCHGPGKPHVAAKEKNDKKATMQVSYEAAQCGRCHREYAEWEKSRHADGYAFGYEEIAKPLLLNCTKCHYPRGFADATELAREKRQSFGKVAFKKAVFPGGPSYFDFDRLPPVIGEGVSCQTCHDPHRISRRNRTGLRVSKSEICGTCHESKWQNVLLEQTAGQTGSAFEYPGAGYRGANPHNTEEKCLLCHMNRPTRLADENGVAALGGHTFRMRDAGPDGRLGGFGPAPDDPARRRDGYGADDTLNLAPCRRCHTGVATFDIRGRQTEIYGLWARLGQRLSALNGGALPGYKPGDKCAVCHRGGTMPFDNDPQLVLENAYTNYKLVGNDRSWGIHNYAYTKRLLEDSLRSLDSM